MGPENPAIARHLAQISSSERPSSRDLVGNALVLITAVLVASSIVLAVLDNMRELEELRSKALKDLHEPHQAGLLVEAVIYDRSSQELRLLLRNARNVPITPSELRESSFVVITSGRTFVLRYSEIPLPGTWSLVGQLRTIGAGEGFVVRLHMTPPVPDYIRLLALLLPTYASVRNITVLESLVVPR
ncbi:MAG: hypothetical protein QXJ49_06090 [Nitrososphaerota archaeon]